MAMLTKQVNHYQRLQSLESELRELEDSAKNMVERIKGLETSRDPMARHDLVMARKVLAHDLKTIKLYKAEIAKIKRTRPSA